MSLCNCNGIYDRIFTAAANEVVAAIKTHPSREAAPQTDFQKTVRELIVQAAKRFPSNVISDKEIYETLQDVLAAKNIDVPKYNYRDKFKKAPDEFYIVLQEVVAHSVVPSAEAIARVTLSSLGTDYKCRTCATEFTRIADGLSPAVA
jgi:hypothetical protein